MDYFLSACSTSSPEKYVLFPAGLNRPLRGNHIMPVLFCQIL
ncbi:hypothetical protein HMPREF1548_03670 [Clostridium sp. KLE 1755]|nr:hypothetical protein HMPREF1548_03670 [Clostridium sp. KLE 1755]